MNITMSKKMNALMFIAWGFMVLPVAYLHTAMMDLPGYTVTSIYWLGGLFWVIGAMIIYFMFLIAYTDNREKDGKKN